MRLSQSPDERARAVSLGTIMYFLGKLDGRSPKYDLQTHLLDVQSHMTQDVLVSEAKRCEGEIKTRADAVNTIGHNLATAARPLATPPPSPGAPPATPPA